MHLNPTAAQTLARLHQDRLRLDIGAARRSKARGENP